MERGFGWRSGFETFGAACRWLVGGAAGMALKAVQAALGMLEAADLVPAAYRASFSLQVAVSCPGAGVCDTGVTRGAVAGGEDSVI